MIKVFRVMLTIGLCTLISCTTYASDIDLSSISSNDSTSHNCIYESKFDTTNHWKECLICKEVNNIEKHSLSTKYTISSTSCNKENKKIESCSTCSYYNESQYYTNSHRYTEIAVGASVLGERFILSGCSNCNGYLDTRDGHKYYYSDGSLVEPNTIKPGAYIRNEDGNYSTIGLVRNSQVTDFDYNTTIDIVNNSTAIVTANLKIPEKYHGWSESTLKNSTYLDVYGNIYNNGSNLQRIYPSSKSYDSANKIMTFKFSFSLRNSNDNCDAPIEITPTAYFKTSYGSYWYADIYYGVKELVTTNFIEPAITSAEY